MKFIAWLRSQGRMVVVVISVIAMASATDSYAQAGPLPTSIGTVGRIYLPAIGSTGGGQFFAPCPPQRNLVGFDMRVGDDVDAIRPACAKSFALGAASHLPFGQDFPPVSTDWNGGPGGSYLRLECPLETPIVIGLDVAAQGQRTVIVHNVHLFCGRAVAAQSASSNPSAVYDGNGYEHPNLISQSERCPAGQVAVGIHGRAGVWLDAMGLICDALTVWTAPRSNAETLKTISSAICVLAREARAQNSPNAPDLEEKCRAAGSSAQTGPVKTVGRIKVPTPADAASRSVCDVAAEARERNSPAATGLETNCRASLAAIGAAIAQADPGVADARTAEANVQFQQGFDIATGIFGDPALGAQGNRATGPRSLSIRSFLSAPGQRGFDASVKLHLSRNYNP